MRVQSQTAAYWATYTADHWWRFSVGGGLEPNPASICRWERCGEPQQPKTAGRKVYPSPLRWCEHWPRGVKIKTPAGRATDNTCRPPSEKDTISKNCAKTTNQTIYVFYRCSVLLTRLLSFVFPPCPAMSSAGEEVKLPEGSGMQASVRASMSEQIRKTAERPGRTQTGKHLPSSRYTLHPAETRLRSDQLWLQASGGNLKKWYCIVQVGIVNPPSPYDFFWGQQ